MQLSAEYSPCMFNIQFCPQHPEERKAPNSPSEKSSRLQEISILGFFPPFLFLFFPFFYFIYAYARVPCVHRYPERPESISFPGAGVAGSCEPPDMGAGRHTQVLCISSQCSSLWTIFQFAFFLAAVRAGHCKPHSLWLRVLPHIQGWL